MISRFIYRIFFKTALDRLELILFRDMASRRGFAYDEISARDQIEKERG